MRKQDIPAIIIDANLLLRRFRLPYWTLAQIRQLRVGEGLIFTSFVGPDVCDSDGEAAVTISREQGGFYRLEAGWMLHLGKNAQRRGHLWSWAYIKLLPGRKLELIQRDGAPGEDTRVRALRAIEVVVRRAALLARWAKQDGDVDAFRALQPSRFTSRHGQEAGAVAWLEKRRGPALVRNALFNQTSVDADE